MSPSDAPESSWLVKDRDEELKEEDASEERIEREDDEDGEKDKGV